MRLKQPMKEGSPLTKWDILKVFWRWQLSCEMSNSYERMQAIAFCYAILPALKKLYPHKEDFLQAVERHSAFFNTEGTVGSIILGMSVALEEENARAGSPLSGEAIASFKTAAMGPVAGLGDTLTWGVMKPTVFSLAVLIAINGSVLGWAVIFLFALITGVYSWQLMSLGYRQGRSALSRLMNSDFVQRVLSGMGIFSLFISGGLAANSVQLDLLGSAVKIDEVFPGILSLLLILAISFYFKKSKSGQKFGKVTVVLVLVGLLLGVLGLV